MRLGLISDTHCGAGALMQEFGEFGADYAVYGHTHHELVHRVDSTVVNNPGSAGEPRNGFRVSYAILDSQSGEVTMELFDDPSWPAAPAALGRGQHAVRQPAGSHQ